MSPEDVLHQQGSWKILTEWNVPVQADYEGLVRDCASSVARYVRELCAPTSLQSNIREALFEAAADAIGRQAGSQPGSHVLIRLWMVARTMASLRIASSEEGMPCLAGRDSGEGRVERDSHLGWGFFITERAAPGSNSDAEAQETPRQGSIDVFLYLEGDLDGGAY